MSNIVRELIVYNRHVPNNPPIQADNRSLSSKWVNAYILRLVCPYHYERFKAFRDSFPIFSKMVDNYANPTMKEMFYEFFPHCISKMSKTAWMCFRDCSLFGYAKDFSLVCNR